MRAKEVTVGSGCNARVRELVERARVADAVALLRQAVPAHRGDLLDELTVVHADFKRLETERRRDLVSLPKYQDELRRITYQLLDIARILEGAGASSSPAKPAAGRGGAVFLSYNHADAKVAKIIRNTLGEKGIPVRIDAEALRPGEEIRAFIRDSITSTDATVCLVSKRSLLSGWVAIESLFALSVEELWGRRRFVPCFVDKDFLDARFSVTATGVIDRRIDELDELMEVQRKRKVDTVELNEERTRLFGLRNGLGPILARLRGGFCLDMRPRQRKASLARLVAELGAGRAARASHG